LSAIYEQDNEKLAREVEERFGKFSESVMACFEFGNKTPMMKTYLWPRLLGYEMMIPYPAIEPAVRALLGPSTAALDLLDEFLHTNPVGKAMAPTMVAIDNKPSSRLKWYFQSPSTSFASVRQVMTLGGRIQGIDEELESLCDLIKATIPLPSDFPDDAEVTESWQPPEYAKKNFDDVTKLLSGYLYYFDIAPGSQVPGIKFYAPTRLFGTDDHTLAKGITSWMKAHGRGKYCDNYMRVLEGLAEGPLEESKGLHAHISFMSKDGEIDVSSYLATGLFSRTKHAAGNPAN
jgi:DMATS type aromatic prenyltransferase